LESTTAMGSEDMPILHVPLGWNMVVPIATTIQYTYIHIYICGYLVIHRDI